MIDSITRNYLLLRLAETLGVIAVLMIAGTSQRLKYRPVLFKYPQREKQASIAVFILVLISAIVFYITPVGKTLFAGDENQSFIGRFFLGLICLGIAAFFLYRRRQPVTSVGWGAKSNLTIGLRVGIMLVFLIIFLRGKIGSIIDGVTAAQGMALLWLLGISLAEETIFRGYLQLRLNSWLGNSSKWLGKQSGWLATSAMYIVWQLPRLLASPVDLWLNLAVITVQSFLLGWMMQKTGHVAAPALYHAFSDWLSII